ncbi:phosphotransferase, partial [Oryctes borbonicus]
SGDANDFQVHIIVKSVPQSQTRAKSFRSLDFFETEINFYNKVWPQLDAFQKSKKLPELFDSIPLCLATFADGKTDFIALEDLSYQGFKALERSLGLDLDAALFTLKYFAKFHAIAVAYREQHPDEFKKMDEELKETYFDEKFRGWYHGTMDKLCTVIKDAAEKELPPSYLEKIEHIFSQDLYGNISLSLKKRTGLTAITHGDCWPPNFLIQEQDGSKKLALIDFQLSR